MTVPIPEREVFAVMEQMIGTPPYRFEPIDEASARIVEFERKNLFGFWGRVRRNPSWVTCLVTPPGEEEWYTVELACSRGRAPRSRALQLAGLLARGRSDSRTIYRERHIPAGPVTLVASWAGMPYRLRTEPRHDAPPGAEIITATPLEAVEGSRGPLCLVRLPDGTEGWVETDQIVAAPSRATREAQLEASRFV